jgi:hypothetical protein
MSVIEELTAERDRMYEVHNEAFQAWMDAEVKLEMAIHEEVEMEKRSIQARQNIFLYSAGVLFAAIGYNIWFS